MIFEYADDRGSTLDRGDVTPEQIGACEYALATAGWPPLDHCFPHDLCCLAAALLVEDRIIFDPRPPFHKLYSLYDQVDERVSYPSDPDREQDLRRRWRDYLRAAIAQAL